MWFEKHDQTYLFQIFSTLSCDTFSNGCCSGHTVLKIARSCVGGRAAKMINSRCASQLLLSVGFREMISEFHVIFCHVHGILIYIISYHTRSDSYQSHWISFKQREPKNKGNQKQTKNSIFNPDCDSSNLSFPHATAVCPAFPDGLRMGLGKERETLSMFGRF